MVIMLLLQFIADYGLEIYHYQAMCVSILEVHVFNLTGCIPMMSLILLPKCPVLHVRQE